MERLQHLIGTAALAATLAAPAGAQLLLYDGFPAGGTAPVGADQYVSEPASTNGTNNDALHGQSPDLLGFAPGDSWSNQDAVASHVYPRVNSAGLTWTSAAGQTLLASEGSAEIFRSGSISGSQNKGVIRDTDGAIAIGQNSFFLSGLIQFSEGVEGSFRIVVGRAQTGGPRDHFIGFTASGQLTAGTDGTSGTSAETFLAGETHFIVGQFIDGGVGNRTVDLWINPADLTAPGSPDYTFAANHFQGHDINALRLLVQTGNNVSDPSMTFDEIRLGTTWESVTPFTVAEDPVTVIPEPSSLLLAVAGAFAVLRLRRRPR